jgi:hypothetical protein
LGICQTLGRQRERERGLSWISVLQANDPYVCSLAAQNLEAADVLCDQIDFNLQVDVLPIEQHGAGGKRYSPMMCHRATDRLCAEGPVQIGDDVFRLFDPRG